MHNPVLQTLENIIQYTNKRPDSKEAPGNQKNPDRWPEVEPALGKNLLNFNAFFHDFYQI